MKTELLIGALAFVTAIQIIPFGHDHTNPPVVAEPAWDTPQTRTLFMRACADCHSNETVWPWYSHVAPVSWLVAHDVEEGRENFNVSVWGVQKKNKGYDAAEEVEEDDMPPAVYLPTHPEARLTPEEKTALIAGLKATFGTKKPRH
ncbi:heme-binding domain-containing protein [Sulfurimonas sp. HSL-3221]|uniref:heme-binding domain-containing protein n=1 Tax=Sulfurimonadaceae TaxID=2771471 RepID=UPI001E40F3D8|nr:heme-binding domain-containing protein [Sulfurimonas sp. HSL-3221]UFS62577.1 heme-binding domain-containing protein [Sulfurimonas sp. HSL-3221]